VYEVWLLVDGTGKKENDDGTLNGGEIVFENFG